MLHTTMTHQNHQTNGASLEDCHTNFFALVSIFFYIIFLRLHITSSSSSWIIIITRESCACAPINVCVYLLACLLASRVVAVHVVVVEQPKQIAMKRKKNGKSCWRISYLFFHCYSRKLFMFSSKYLQWAAKYSHRSIIFD